MKKIITTALLVAATGLMATDWMRGTAIDGKVRFAPDATTPGYLPIYDMCPYPAGTNYTPVVDYWTNRNGRCECVYKQVELHPSPAPKAYSRIKLEIALAIRGKYPALEAMLSGIEIAPGYTALTAWKSAQVIQDDFEGFQDYYARIIAALGIDKAEADAILASCLAD